MSKAKKRKNHQSPHESTLPPDPHPGGVPIPMAIQVPPELARRMGLMPERSRCTLADLERELRARAGDDVDRFWSVECSADGGIAHPDRDGVLVYVPAQALVETSRADSPGFALRPLVIATFDASLQRTGGSMIDVEDAKRLVNAISEAIAHVEEREGVR